MKVVVDYGHGGQDSGAVSGKILEKNINKLIGERVKYHLERHSQTVILTRRNDEDVTLQERVRIINAYNCDIGISIHCNSFNTPEAQGLEVFTWGTGNKELLLARGVHSAIKDVKLYTKDRGIKQAQFTVLSPNIPICLLECGFISNEQDRQLILDNIENFAIAITKGLLGFYEIAYKQEKPVEATTQGTLYYVQVGAYSSLDNAKKKVEELRLKGIESFIKV